MNNCFSINHTSWITSGPKGKFICDNIPTKAILFFCSCSKVNSTWLITSGPSLQASSLFGSQARFILGASRKRIGAGARGLACPRPNPLAAHAQNKISHLTARAQTNLAWDPKRGLACRLLRASQSAHAKSTIHLCGIVLIYINVERPWHNKQFLSYLLPVPKQVFKWKHSYGNAFCLQVQFQANQTYFQTKAFPHKDSFWRGTW